MYWIPLFQILEERGFEVCLVNARQVKNVPGRRTDVCDCQWLQFLHSVGLLRASYRPEQEVCAVRSLLRHRESLVQMAAAHVHHMQKAMDQMNLQLHHVISDLTGRTGLAILDAILGGERDPFRLAQLRSERIKASPEVIAKSLVSDYRPEHLFTLRQSLTAYRSYQKLMEECDREIRQALESFGSQTPPPAATPREGGRAEPQAESSPKSLRDELQRVWGVDLTQIPGIQTGLPRPYSARWAPTSPSFAALPPLPPGWACARTMISAAARCSGLELAKSNAGLQPAYGWPPNPCTTARPHWAISTGACGRDSALPRPSPPPLSTPSRPDNGPSRATGRSPNRDRRQPNCKLPTSPLL